VYALLLCAYRPLEQVANVLSNLCFRPGCTSRGSKQTESWQLRTQTFFPELLKVVNSHSQVKSQKQYP
jgi:hypothetical protein